MIKYTYDASGNRIGKWAQVGAGTPRQTAYVRDASGNVMAIYEKGNSEVNGGLLSQIEVPLYGSSRLGVWRPDREVETTGWELFDTDPMTGTGGGIAGGWERGRVQFELSNHLGNVLVTISDARTAVDDGTYEVFTICHTCLPGIPCVPCFNDYDKQNSTPDGVVDYYLPQVLTANDYYPFGMGMPGRKFAEDDLYRYGFNGKENDNDVKGEGNQQDYGMRIYDPRLGKFLSVDPLARDFPYYSVYHFAGCNPIKFIDMDGGEPKDYVDNWAPAFLFYHNTNSRVAGTSNNNTTFTVDEPGMGWIMLEGIYDKVTGQNYFVHRNSGTGQHYYYKANDGQHGTLTVQIPKNGLPIVSGGTLVPFETADAERARIMSETADLLRGITVTPLVALPGAITGGFAISSGLGLAGGGSGFLSESAVLEAIESTPELWPWVGYVGGGSTAVAIGSKAIQTETAAAESGLMLMDEAFVIRGGSNKAAQFQNGSGVTIGSNGLLNGVSVNSRNGLTVEELSVGIPHNRIGVTTVGQVRQIGGNVIPSPTKNLNHATLSGITAEQAEALFTPTIPNPLKK